MLFGPFSDSASLRRRHKFRICQCERRDVIFSIIPAGVDNQAAVGTKASFLPPNQNYLRRCESSATPSAGLMTNRGSKRREMALFPRSKRPRHDRRNYNQSVCGVFLSATKLQLFGQKCCFINFLLCNRFDLQMFGRAHQPSDTRQRPGRRFNGVWKAKSGQSCLNYIIYKEIINEAALYFLC